MITYGTLHASGGTREGLTLDEARDAVELDSDKGYITDVVRFVDGELDYFWEDAR